MSATFAVQLREVGETQLIVDETGITDEFFDVSDLTPDNDYEFRAAQDDGEGLSDWSAWTQFSTLVEAPQGSITFDAPAPGHDSVTIGYTYSEADADSFEYRVNGQSIVNVGTTNPYIVGGLDPETFYPEGHIQQRAVNAGGTSGWFDVPEFTTLEEPIAPPEFSGTIDNQEDTQRDEISLDVSSHWTGATSYSATGLPPGLAVDDEGVISGVLTSADVDGSPWTDIVITGSNAEGSDDSNSFTWAVNLAPPVQLLTIPSQHGREEQEEEEVFSGFFDGATDYSASGLPPGLSINSAGVVSGDYSEAGEYQSTITAINDAGSTDSNEFAWLVDPADLLPDLPLDRRTRVDEDTGVELLRTDGGTVVGQDLFPESLYEIRAVYWCESRAIKDDLVDVLRSRVAMTVTFRYFGEDYVCSVRRWMVEPHRSGQVWYVTVEMVGRRA